MTPDPWRIARRLAAGAFAFNLLAVGLVWWSGEQSRHDNCERVAEAFDTFLDLALAVPPDPSVTPEERAVQVERTEAFRAELLDQLDDCS